MRNCVVSFICYWIAFPIQCELSTFRLFYKDTKPTQYCESKLPKKKLPVVLLRLQNCASGWADGAVNTQRTQLFKTVLQLTLFWP